MTTASLAQSASSGAEQKKAPAVKSASVKQGMPGKENVSKKRTTSPVAFQPDDSYIRDRELLDRLQRDTFRYMWEHTYKESGLAYEVRHSGHSRCDGTRLGEPGRCCETSPQDIEVPPR